MARYDELMPRINSETFRKEVTRLVEEQLAQSLDTVEQTVRDEVIRIVPQIIPALLGLRQGFGGRDWEINRTNGIDRSHPVGIAVRDTAQTKAYAVVAEAIEGWKPTKGMLKAIRAEYTERMDYAAREAASAAAERDAVEWAEAFVNDVLDGKFDTPGALRDPEARKVLREIAEGKLTGDDAVRAAAALTLKGE